MSHNERRHTEENRGGQSDNALFLDGGFIAEATSARRETSDDPPRIGPTMTTERCRISSPHAKVKSGQVVNITHVEPGLSVGPLRGTSKLPGYRMGIAGVWVSPSAPTFVPRPSA